MRALRVIVAAVTVLLAVAITTESPASANAAPPTFDAGPGADLTCRPRAECCKVCQKGQACGDSCISRDKQCHKGRGCACDADEVCE